MRVMFVSNDGKESVVKYGSGQDRLDMVVGTRVGRYEREHMCDSPANISIGWRDPGYIHDGVMVNLKKGVQYYYKEIREEPDDIAGVFPSKFTFWQTFPFNEHFMVCCLPCGRSANSQYLLRLTLHHH
ncbi:hypothetical protein AgCh_028681 [Apium graveolens]